MIEKITLGTRGESPKREEDMSPVEKAKAWLALQGAPAWGEGVTSDFLNVSSGLSLKCEAEPLWSRIKPIPSIEEYIEQKFAGTEAVDASEIASAAIQQTNQEFLGKANAIIAEMNAIIGGGVTSQGQVDALLDKNRSFIKLLRSREG